MTATYTVYEGTTELLTFEADFARASSQIMIVGDRGANGTPFRVADARHRPVEAAKLLNRWCRSEGGECWAKGTTGLTLRTRR